MLPCKVQLTEKVEKQLEWLPTYIERKFRTWVRSVVEDGIYIVRKRPGFHDEPLSGTRFGQRSVRLNKAYRIIYIQTKSDEIHIIQVIEVNRHEY